MLISCIKELAEQRNDFVVVIAGSGQVSYEEKIRGMAHQSGLEKYAWFPGFVQGAEKSLLLSGADMFVLPSKDENFGLAVLEAMAYGLPVVISKETGISCYLTHEVDAMILQNKEDELSSAMVELLDVASRREELGDNARRLVQTRFSWDSVAQEIYNMYKQCIW